MQTKHTPGPWLTAATNRIGYIYIQDSDGVAITDPSPLKIADARLIAAAPELLAALRHLLEDAVALNMGESDRSGVLVEARAAIAKATGGQP